MATSFCVTCRVPSDSTRCPRCARRFVDGGGIRRVDKVRGALVRVAETTFECAATAKFCHLCGGTFSPESQRRALLNGVELYTCWFCRKGVDRNFSPSLP